jgi:hypothetical protein
VPKVVLDCTIFIVIKRERRIQTTKMFNIIKVIAFYALLIAVVIFLLEVKFAINHGYLLPIKQISDFRSLF